MYNCAYLTGLPTVGCGVKLQHCAVLPPVGCSGGQVLGQWGTGAGAVEERQGWLHLQERSRD